MSTFNKMDEIFRQNNADHVAEWLTGFLKKLSLKSKELVVSGFEYQ